MAIIANRNPPQVNGIVEDVYVHQGIQMKTRSHFINCFDSMNSQNKQFYYHSFTAFIQSPTTKHLDFYVKFPQILFLGEYRDANTELDDSKQFFTKLRELGFHIYINYWGHLVTIFCYADSNDNKEKCLNPISIDDMYPRFYHEKHQTVNLPTLIVGQKLHITGSHASPSFCGTAADHYYEHERNKYTNVPFANSRERFKFGIYVERGAKLVVAEDCIRCKGTKDKNNQNADHHIRSLVMGGGFIMVEGPVLFQFATEGLDNTYTKTDVVSQRKLDIPVGALDNCRTPIFFLKALTSKYGSLCWGLTYSCQKNTTNKRWIFTIPENGVFEVHPYERVVDNNNRTFRTAGIYGVQTNQFNQPWYDDGYLDKPTGNVNNRYCKTEDDVIKNIDPRVEWNNRVENAIKTTSNPPSMATIDIALRRSVFQNYKIEYGRVGNAWYKYEKIVPETGKYRFIFCQYNPPPFTPPYPSLKIHRTGHTHVVCEYGKKEYVLHINADVI